MAASLYAPFKPRVRKFSVVDIMTTVFAKLVVAKHVFAVPVFSGSPSSL